MKKSVEIELKEIMEKYGWQKREDINWEIIRNNEKLSRKFIKRFIIRLRWVSVTKCAKVFEKYLMQDKS